MAVNRRKKTKQRLSIKPMLRYLKLPAYLALLLPILFLGAQGLMNSEIVDVVLTLEGSAASTELRSEIIARTKKLKGQTLFEVEETNVAELFKGFSDIKGIRIRRMFPSKLAVHVQLHEPFLLVQGAELSIMSRAGVIYRQYSGQIDPPPIVTFDSTNIDSGQLRLAFKFAEVLEKQQPTSWSDLSEIRVNSNKGVSTIMMSNLSTIHWGDKDWLKKMSRYYQIIEKLPQLHPQVVDLAFSDRAYVKL